MTMANPSLIDGAFHLREQAAHFGSSYWDTKTGCNSPIAAKLTRLRLSWRLTPRICAAIVAHQGLGFRGVTVAVSPPLYARHLSLLTDLWSEARPPRESRA